MNGYNYDNNLQNNANGYHMELDSVPKIDFYTSRISPYCRAVKMLATHLNIPLNEIYVRPWTDTNSEEFKKINPSHTIPTINDNGFILWESRAIMQYLCNKYAPNSFLYPKDPELRATVDRLLNFDLKTLSHAVLKAHFEFTFPTEFSASRSDQMVELIDSLTFLEIFLINKDYVAGDTLTIADISLLANVTHLEIAVEFDLSSYPNIWGWFNRLRRELPYYDQQTKVSHAENRELIRSLRSAHDEWSSAHFCAFTPCEQHDGHDVQDQNVDQYNVNPLFGYTFNNEEPQNGHTYNGDHFNDQTYNAQTYNAQSYNGQINGNQNGY